MKSKAIVILYMLLMIISSSFAVWTRKDEIQYNGIVKFDNLEEFDDGWRMDGKVINLPLDIKTNNDTIILTNSLPYCTSKSTFAFHSQHTYVKVYIDDKLIYETLSKDGTNGVPPSVWNIVDINESHSYKNIRLEITSYRNIEKGKFGTTYIGDTYSIINHLIQNDLFASICIVIMAIGALLIFIVSVFCVKNEDRFKVINIAIFVVYALVWSGNETIFPQLLFHSMQSYTQFAYVAMLLLPIPLVMFGYCLKTTKFNHWYLSIMGGNCVVLSICLFLHLTGVRCLGEMIWVFQANIAVTLISLFILLVYSMKKETESLEVLKPFLVGITILMICMGIDGILYYLKEGIDALTFTRVGIIILEYGLVATYFTLNREYLTLGTKSEKYRRLAYTDSLTNVNSRVAYQVKLDEIEANLKSNEYAVFSIDLNNLKVINDSQGHAKGDEYIRNSAKLLANICKENDMIYRVGGDEFIIIISKNYEDTISNLKKTIEETEYMAYGYAEYEPRDTSLSFTIRRADNLMYENKFLKKNKYIEKRNS